jgi:hypothetical protein
MIFSAMLISCTLKEELPEEFLSEVNNIKTKWAPDKRTKVFNIEYQYDDERDIWQISGETTEREAKSSLEQLVKAYFANNRVLFNLDLLPHPSLADTIYGVVNVSVGNLKKERGHRTELVDQVLMGTVLRLLKHEWGWYLVQTPYEYLGWITKGTVTEMTRQVLLQWQNQDKLVLDVNFAQVFSEPSSASQIICDAVLGSVFLKRAARGYWQEVEIPDGRTGYIEKKNLKKYIKSDSTKLPGRQDVVEQAKKMMGIPYLWGGHSTKGLDCSGFTSTVFRSLGYQLPRDANMQVELGQEINPAEDFSNILPGDLIFFGPENRITHVGICLGGPYFIHASGDVHINSLDEQDELFNEDRKKAYKNIKRIIKN